MIRLLPNQELVGSQSLKRIKKRPTLTLALKFTSK
eukprot:UN20043